MTTFGIDPMRAPTLPSEESQGMRSRGEMVVLTAFM